MRISDWSSDVCSSDLYPIVPAPSRRSSAARIREDPRSRGPARAPRRARGPASDHPLVRFQLRVLLSLLFPDLLQPRSFSRPSSFDLCYLRPPLFSLSVALLSSLFLLFSLYLSSFP